MKDRMWSLIHGARRVESAMTSRIEDAARQVSGTHGMRPPLEVVHAAIDAIAREIQPVGRGRHGFPFNVVKVTFAAPSSRERSQLRGVCEGPVTFEARVRERLQAAGCEASDLLVKVLFVPHPADTWLSPEFNVDLARRAAAAEAGPAPAPPIRLTVLEGATAHPEQQFTRTPITIGRGAEVRDPRQRLVRVNHVAFLDDGGPVGQSVSRRHARIERDEGTGAVRVIDDGSAQGTDVIRGGRGIPVPPGTRGLRLQSGDEIVAGRARVRIEFG